MSNAQMAHWSSDAVAPCECGFAAVGAVIHKSAGNEREEKEVIPLSEKHRTETVVRLQEATQQGIEQGLWPSIEACAGRLRMNRNTFRSHYDGRVGDNHIQRTLERVQQLLRGEEPPLPQEESSPSAEELTVSALSAELCQLFEQGKVQGCWDSISSCARIIHVPRRTLSTYLSYRGSGGTLFARSMRSVIRKMRRKLQEQEAERAQPVRETTPTGALLLVSVLQQIATAGSQHVLQSMAELLPSAWARVLENLAGDPLASSENLAQLLQEGLRLIVQDYAQSISPAGHPQDVVAGTLFDRVLSGVAELRDQNLNGVRFVLNARNFRKLHGQVTREEVEDTGLLIEELVRRFAIFAQLDNVGHRSLIAQKLSEKLERLYRIIEQSRNVCPTEAAEEIGRDRQTQNLFS